MDKRQLRKLSPAMIDAIEVAAARGGALVRIRDTDFWTWPGCPEKDDGSVDWFVRGATLYGLTVRDLMKIAGYDAGHPGSVCRVALMPHALMVARAKLLPPIDRAGEILTPLEAKTVLIVLRGGAINDSLRNRKLRLSAELKLAAYVARKQSQ